MNEKSIYLHLPKNSDTLFSFLNIEKCFNGLRWVDKAVFCTRDKKKGAMQFYAGHADISNVFMLVYEALRRRDVINCIFVQIAG
ncbi:hypothetical protein PROVALCAL_00522 [Providencia alcalifaciens DSM 30120]|uniref:Uncharacterized protein n=1 Tax=Providencia alcalifaciens DSM 30120 TaxID=520999 RepID=B6XB67_9GAMM|nr:hypothetical protein PROVALCAL_00522 [Providencia alcalifaciens DSM 30120]